MLMQFNEQSMAKLQPASTKPRVPGMLGNRATIVPAANKMPIAHSFAGSDRQISPSG